METRLVADVPQSHQLRWPPAASVVARRLGGGDWAIAALVGLYLAAGGIFAAALRKFPRATAS